MSSFTRVPHNQPHERFVVSNSGIDGVTVSTDSTVYSVRLRLGLLSHLVRHSSHGKNRFLLAHGETEGQATVAFPRKANLYIPQAVHSRNLLH
eukprot:3959954-Amphidinium_carterae.1